MSDSAERIPRKAIDLDDSDLEIVEVRIRQKDKTQAPAASVPNSKAGGRKPTSTTSRVPAPSHTSKRLRAQTARMHRKSFSPESEEEVFHHSKNNNTRDSTDSDEDYTDTEENARTAKRPSPRERDTRLTKSSGGPDENARSIVEEPSPDVEEALSELQSALSQASFDAGAASLLMANLAELLEFEDQRIFNKAAQRLILEHLEIDSPPVPTHQKNVSKDKKKVAGGRPDPKTTAKRPDPKTTTTKRPDPATTTKRPEPSAADKHPDPKTMARHSEPSTTDERDCPESNTTGTGIAQKTTGPHKAQKMSVETRTGQKTKKKGKRTEPQKTAVLPPSSSDAPETAVLVPPLRRSGRQAETQPVDTDDVAPRRSRVSAAAPHSAIFVERRSSAAHATATSTLEELPEWMSEAVLYLRTDISDEEHWIGLVDRWVEFESALGFPDTRVSIKNITRGRALTVVVVQHYEEVARPPSRSSRLGC